MNILMFNTYNPKLASGIVALDLFDQLHKRGGHNVKLLVNRYDPDYPEGIVCMETWLMSLKRTILYKLQWRYDKLISRLKLKKNNTNPDYRFFQLKEKKQIYNTDSLLRKTDLKPDAIIILFVNKFLNAKNIFELQQITNAPIFWLMYDMAPLTGGCHYAWECKGYYNRCGNCPGLFSQNAHDLSHENILLKESYFNKTQIEVLTASEWQYEQAKRSLLFKNNTIHKVLLSVDSGLFKPVDKESIRIKLEIPVDKKVLFFGSVGLAERRKGMRYLIESLKLLKQKIDDSLAGKILLLIAGRDIEQIADDLPFKYHYMGMVDSGLGIASAYQAADIFICPSIEDSGPMMINQSLMCGTPVVSFEMGVALDLVKSGETGYRAKLKNSDDLTKGIIDILSMNPSEYCIVAENCRKLALKLCSPEVRIEKINNILKQHNE